MNNLPPVDSAARSSFENQPSDRVPFVDTVASVLELGNWGPRHSWARRLDPGSNPASGTCGLGPAASPEHPSNGAELQFWGLVVSSPLVKCKTLRNLHLTPLVASPDLWGSLPQLLGVYVLPQKHYSV